MKLKKIIDTIEIPICIHYRNGCDKKLLDETNCDGLGKYFSKIKLEHKRCERYAIHEYEIWRTNI